MQEIVLENDRARGAFLILAAALVLSTAVQGQEAKKKAEPPVGETGEAIAAPQPYQKLSFTYFGEYAGPALSQPTRGGTINTTTLDYDDGSPQNLYNQFKLDYNITSNLFVGPVVNFYLVPVPDQSHFVMSDSGLRIGHKQILHSDSANLMADFRVMAPLRPSYRAKDEQLNLQSLEIFTYAVPKTKLTLGILGFHYYQVYGSGAPARVPTAANDPRDLNMYFAPNATYQFAKSVAATLYFEMYPYHLLGDSWTNFRADPSDIAPGINWDITPDFSVNPQLLIYPSRLSWSTLSPVLYISAKFI